MGGGPRRGYDGFEQQGASGPGAAGRLEAEGAELDRRDRTGLLSVADTRNRTADSQDVPLPGHSRELRRLWPAGDRGRGPADRAYAGVTGACSSARFAYRWRWLLIRFNP